ncbi:hypothetical protein TWF102_008240 [Orbilia oligospora]|uniref:Uncharacterized protein n=1 Tax=Orbilia oligospora TaxID=2813651 RepID=A0A7C8NJ95_ORBOL|nr:hypothetical protein TWF102_008240 [Orbilia oligospora]KAF3114724.1 hypothetical protein TWF103_000461 [Orbilia oligospora]
MRGCDVCGGRVAMHSSPVQSGGIDHGKWPYSEQLSYRPVRTYRTARHSSQWRPCRSRQHAFSFVVSSTQFDANTPCIAWMFGLHFNWQTSPSILRLRYTNVHSHLAAFALAKFCEAEGGVLPLN